MPVTLRTVVLWCFLSGAAMAETVTVFAAASLRGALDEVAAAYEDQTGHDVILSYAGTSALARQIGFGAPADVFFSANPGWMDVVARDGLIVEGSRVDLLGNRLALVAAGPVVLDDLTLLPQRLGDGRLAIALVEAVPAGIYGKAALQSLGLWDDLSARVVQTDNVRAALALVALQEAAFGIVYATDAQADDRVQVVALLPDTLHPPILYPVAALTEAGTGFVDFLASPQALALFADHGFLPRIAP